jgi:pimeloyl-ACP methyl ester carboxylesterase
MATYDISSMACLSSLEYTRLRAPSVQSQREKDTMAQIIVRRNFYDLLSTRCTPSFASLETMYLAPADTEGRVLVAVGTTLKPVSGAEERFSKWYEEEHIPLLSRIHGWRRTRCFRTSSVIENCNGNGDAEIEYLALHDYASVNGLGGLKFHAATDTPWQSKIFEDFVERKWGRVYTLFYTFGPAPRDLASISCPESIPGGFSSPDGLTRTLVNHNQAPAIESYIAVPDGLRIPYRLEGSSSPTAPLLVLCNSTLVSWGIWDRFLSHFWSRNPRFRILRFNTRGRQALPLGSHAANADVTLDVLSADAIALLDALRVEKASAVVGMSLGGATALNIALKAPHRIERFVACDFNIEGQGPVVWGEGIGVAERDGRANSVVNGEWSKSDRCVSKSLAELTVRRWFVPESYDSGDLEAETGRVKRMVASNSLAGFRAGVRALYDSDLRKGIRNGSVRGLFIVGEYDEVLPDVTKKAAEEYRKDSGDSDSVRMVESLILQMAGHLPLVEKPKEFCDALSVFLENS